MTIDEKPRIIAIEEIIMDDFSINWKVSILFSEIPKLLLGECEVKQK